MKIRIVSEVLTDIENHVAKNHRSMFYVFGNRANEKVPWLLHLTRRCVSNCGVMKLLWVQQKGNNISRKLDKKWQKKLKRSSIKDFKNEDPFEMMVVGSDITFCEPAHCHKVLGQTYDACIFENFKALNPNVLARCIETVKGGGIIIFLLESLTQFDQLFQLEMDVHAKYKTDWFPDIKPRFNKRFVASLTSCTSAYSVSEDFRINSLCKQPPGMTDGAITDENRNIISAIRNKIVHSEEIKRYLKLIDKCATPGQVAVVLEFLRLVRCTSSDKSIVSLTSGRGRGKSASLGLGLAVAISSGLSRIGVTSPSIENVQTLLSFTCIGLDALGYKENVDYFIGRTSEETDSFLLKIEIKRMQRQVIEYRSPQEINTLIQADLLCIDEAAAIPLNLTKKLLKAKICVISSTIQGYEGTGRSLSLKLLEDLRRKSHLIVPLNLSDVPKMIKDILEPTSSQSGASMIELTLSNCIRYSDSDPIELWIDRLFCLSTSESVPTFVPSLDQCQLYQVDQDLLFSGCLASEEVLTSIVAVYVASHYKNSPNDLMMLADAPAHKLFCLVSSHSSSSPQVICVIQAAMEGNVREESMKRFWENGERPSGDLMGWTVEQQFPGQKFSMRKGMRVVRIATHSSFQKMGFGKRAMDLLIQHCQQNQTAKIKQNEAQSKVIFKSLDEAEALGSIEHIGASFGASLPLIRFWKSLKMQPVYLSQVSNEVTGEHSCIFLRDLHSSKNFLNSQDMWMDFRLRFLRLLPHSFRLLDSSSALELVIYSQVKSSNCSNDILQFSKLDKERLKNYAEDKLEMRAVFDLLHEVSRQFFISGNFCNISHDKLMIMLAVGLQGKSFDDVASELNETKIYKNKGKNSNIYDTSSVAGLLNQTFKSFVKKSEDTQEKTKYVIKHGKKRKKLSEE